MYEELPSLTRNATGAYVLQATHNICRSVSHKIPTLNLTYEVQPQTEYQSNKKVKSSCSSNRHKATKQDHSGTATINKKNTSNGQYMRVMCNYMKPTTNKRIHIPVISIIQGNNSDILPVSTQTLIQITNGIFVLCSTWPECHCVIFCNLDDIREWKLHESCIDLFPFIYLFTNYYIRS